MKKILIVILILLNTALASQEIKSGCLPPNDNAERGLKWFLQLDQPNFKSVRNKVGIKDDLTEQLIHVNKTNECRRLTELIEKNNDWNIDLSQRDKHYYRTDGFIFIIYVNKNLGTGYTPLVVLDKDFNFLGKFAI